MWLTNPYPKTKWKDPAQSPNLDLYIECKIESSSLDRYHSQTLIEASHEDPQPREDLKLSFAEMKEKILVASDLADAECAAKLDPRDGKDPIYDPDKPLPEGFAWVSLFLGGTGKTYVSKIFCFHCGGKHMSDQCSIKGTAQAIEFQKSNDLYVSVDTLVIPK